MKTIFLDVEFRCHVKDDGTMYPIETNIFDGKSDKFIEGYRYIPAGCTWMREDGTIFAGEMVSPWKPYSELESAQRDYEKQLIADYESALSKIESALGV